MDQACKERTQQGIKIKILLETPEKGIMKKLTKVMAFILSLLVISISVVILIVVSCLSMLFNALLFLLMVTGLGLPMAGNMIKNKIRPTDI
jgi:hypothetical protein